MKIAIVAASHARHQVAAAALLAAGIRAFGDEAVVVGHRVEIPPGIDAVACWSWRVGRQFRNDGINVLVMERGYVADRFEWISLGWNGLNGHARFACVEDGGQRWRRHFGGLMQPWRAGGDGYALLLGQVPTDTAVREIHFPTWAARVAEALRQQGREVRFRAHPLAPALAVGGVAPTQGTLAEDLAGAALAVTFNSNAGVDAVLAGVPTVAVDRGSMAWEVATHTLHDQPRTPEREPWAHRLAWAQWLPEEIEHGEAWAHLRHLI